MEQAAAAAAVVVKCPRCDSPNTKFCYYNNYSLNQPRHFCKTCRRYWTKGGALRNVPVGGGCRKNKRCRPSSSDKSGGGGGLCSASIDQLQRLSMYPALPQKLPSPGRSAYAESRAFPLHGGFGSLAVPGAADGCLVGGLGVPSLSFADLYTPGGFGSHNYRIQALLGGAAASGSPSSSSAANPSRESLASSIESLSSVNQLLHWKLQQQRLGVLQLDSSSVSAPGALPASANYRPFQIQQPPPPSHAAGRGVQSSDPARLLDGEGGWCAGNSCIIGGFDLAADTSNWSTGIPNWSTDVLHQFNH